MGLMVGVMLMMYELVLGMEGDFYGGFDWVGFDCVGFDCLGFDYVGVWGGW